MNLKITMVLALADLSQMRWGSICQFLKRMNFRQNVAVRGSGIFKNQSSDSGSASQKSPPQQSQANVADTGDLSPRPSSAKNNEKEITELEDEFLVVHRRPLSNASQSQLASLECAAPKSAR